MNHSGEIAGNSEVASKKKKKTGPNCLSLRKLKEDGSVIKTKEKPGKVVRLNPSLWSLLSRRKKPGETISDVVLRLIDSLPDSVLYVLPSSCHLTIEEARGAAVVEKVKRRLKSPEKPIPVKILE